MPMKRYLHRIASLVGIALSPVSLGSDLLEFSTSMAFIEFATVIKHLKKSDETLASELSREIASFKANAAIGVSQRYDLANAQGYVVLEREDDYALSIEIFTDASAHAKIDAAFTSATEEMGI